MTTPKQFYDTLLDEISVDHETMQHARTKRDEIGAAAVNILKTMGLSEVRFFGSGAVAQGTQNDPLNDVDVVVEVADILPTWQDDPRQALVDICDQITGQSPGSCEIGTHAIKLDLDDEPFTADLVFGLTRSDGGIYIPHCPRDEQHRWIETDPEQHRELVIARNRPHDRAVFSRQIRILKQWSAWCRYADEENRKPLASFHITALALHILGDDWNGHDQWTVQFFEQAAELVHTPLPAPTGIGEPLTTRDPDYAAAHLRRAADETRRALTAPPEQVEEILRGVFGDPALLKQIVSDQSIAVDTRGKFVPAASVAIPAAARVIKPVRSYGDDATT
jgi:hypothetical protein